MPKPKKTSIRELLEKIFKVNLQFLKLQKENSKLSRRDSKINISLQTIAIIIAVATLVVALQIKSFFQTNTNLDYALRTEMTAPKQIILNDDETTFTFNFTNVGSKNITNFQISQIIFYRDEDELLRQVYVPSQFNQNQYLVCSGYISYPTTTSIVLAPEESCVLKDVSFSCKGPPKCFDDKQKTMHLFFYFVSVPPLPNAILNLTLV